MAKVMLVEDDNNLREIYEASLAAEGYEIVSARDGEEALALAIKEKPDLIVADIMMPKVSGLDMLDILRQTPETKNAKIIMMTALSQAEDKARAEKLGADRYLVKSQVTLEDVVRVAAELLADGKPAAVAGGAPTTEPAVPAIDPAAVSTPVVAAPPAPTPEPAAATPTPTVTVATPPEPVAVTPTPAAPTVTPEPVTPSAPPVPNTPVVDAPAATPTSTTDDAVKPADTPTPVTVSTPTSSETPSDTGVTAAPTVTPISVTDTSAVTDNATPTPVATPAEEPARKTITITDAPEEPKAEESKEESPEPVKVTIPADLGKSTAKEEAELEKKVENFIAGNPTLTTSAEPTKEPEQTEKPIEVSKDEPEPVTPKAEAPAEPKPDTDATKPADGVEAEETIANAMDSLTGTIGGDKQPEDKPAIEVAKPKEAPTSIDSGGPEKVKHTKVIEPPADFKVGGPDLDALLAKEGITMDDNPPAGGPEAHTVISPDGVPLTGPAPGVITPNAAPSPGSDIQPANAENIAL